MQWLLPSLLEGFVPTAKHSYVVYPEMDIRILGLGTHEPVWGATRFGGLQYSGGLQDYTLRILSPGMCGSRAAPLFLFVSARRSTDQKRCHHGGGADHMAEDLEAAATVAVEVVAAGTPGMLLMIAVSAVVSCLWLG